MDRSMDGKTKRAMSVDAWEGAGCWLHKGRNTVPFGAVPQCLEQYMACIRYLRNIC